VTPVRMTTEGKKEGGGTGIKTVGTLENIYLTFSQPFTCYQVMACAFFSNVLSLNTVVKIVLFFLCAWTPKGY